jgi:hypothetical protein
VSSFKTIPLLALLALCLASACPSAAQSSFYQHLRANNSRMAAYQPTWMAPLCQTDTRLGQGVKFSVANLRAPGMNQIVYGNNHGFSTIVGNRIQFDFDPPSYFRNHSATQPDGFGNAAVQVKYRIASGNAQHGNYALTAVLTHSFAPRAYQNGYFSSLYYPKLGYGRAFGRLSVQTMLDGQLPTANIYAQGRAIDFNTTAQFHPSLRLWLDIENNATYLFAGPFDGATQNFITPAAFYAVRHNSWGPGHALLIFDTGMQIATSRFHYYNHNLITEMRLSF